MSVHVVTGGAGFIGSHLVEALLARGERVRVVDNLSSGRRGNVDAAVEAAARAGRPFARPEFVVGDLGDPDFAVRALEGAGLVFHQAAIPSVPRSVKEPVETNRANLDGTLNVLVAAREAGARRVVFAGSSAVFGDMPLLPKREDMPTRPLSPYALQKLAGEEYLKLFAALYGLETVTVRYFNVFGPRQDPSSPYSGVISLFIKALLAGTAPTIHGDGGQTRDFTYVSNVVDGVLKAADTPEAAGEVIHVATGHRTSLSELLGLLQQIIGTALAPAFGPAREGDVRDSQADIGKAGRLLGYAPAVSLEDGLRRTVEWYRATAGS
jgi:nucleoside-diphosphate-sugar epimerase